MRQTELRPRDVKFISISEAGPLFDTQVKKTYELFHAEKRLLEEQFRRPLTEAEERLVFETLYYRSQNEPLVILDTPRIVPDVPFRLYSRLNIDHHGKGVWFDQTHPNRNTTSLVLDYLKWAKDEVFPKDPKLAALFVKNRLQVVSSDNLGDASMAIWAIKNLDRLATDSALEKRLRFMAFNEDFGIFGSRIRERETNLDFLAQFLPEKYGEAGKNFGDLLSRQRVILSGYDKILKEAGISSSDRYGTLSPDQQVKLAMKAVEVVDRAVLGNAADLAEESNAYIETIRNARTAFNMDSAKYFEDLKKDPELKMEDFHAVNYEVQVYRTGDIPSRFGVFASWVAGATNSSKQASLNMGDGTFIMSVVDGRAFRLSLEKVSEAVRTANVEKTRRLWKGKVSDFELQEKLDAASKAVGDRGPRLAFSFGGLSLTQGELLHVIAELLRQSKR